MSALLQPITALAIEPTSYGHWKLVQTNDQAAWIRANWVAIKTRFRSFGEPVADDCTLQEYAISQWEMERARRDEYRADGRFDHDYVDRDGEDDFDD